MITRNNDLNIGIMKKRITGAGNISRFDRSYEQTSDQHENDKEKKDSNAKGSTDREQPTSKKLREIMICGRSSQKCHVDDFTPNRKMGEKRKMIRG